MKHDSHHHFEKAKRIVVKLGSNILSRDSGLNVQLIQSISRQICGLVEDGLEIIVVSSGAMASGIRKIGLDHRPTAIPKRQAVAAVGQAGLILEYEKAFGYFGYKVAQILLTSEDLNNRRRYLNGRNTLNTLLDWGVIPIINENDTVMVEEIKVGDNDNLSAMIALLMDADMLVNLTDIDGLYTKDPRRFEDAKLIAQVTSIKNSLLKIASDIPGALGSGGMQSKIKAARKVTAAGISMVIAKGDKKDILTRLFKGQAHGTFFVPRKERMASRKCWIAFTLNPKGAVMVDDGAAAAILDRGKSLLPSGILEVQGEFSVGAAVKCINKSNESLGIGLVNYSAADIRKIKGLNTKRIAECLGQKTYDEVIHRDNLAVLS